MFILLFKNPQPVEKLQDDENETQVNLTNVQIPNLEEEPFFGLLAQNIKKLINYIGGSEEPETKPIDTQFGKPVKPFGLIRLKLIELLLYAVKVNSAKVNQQIASSKVFLVLQVCIDY